MFCCSSLEVALNVFYFLVKYSDFGSEGVGFVQRQSEISFWSFCHALLVWSVLSEQRWVMFCFEKVPRPLFLPVSYFGGGMSLQDQVTWPGTHWTNLGPASITCARCGAAHAFLCKFLYQPFLLCIALVFLCFYVKLKSPFFCFSLNILASRCQTCACVYTFR